MHGDLLAQRTPRRSSRARPRALFNSSAGMAVLLASATACQGEREPHERQIAPGTGVMISPPTSGIQAGANGSRQTYANPYEGNVQALKEGERLYTWFNCADCHGVQGGGGMGVPLADFKWIYGESPAHIFQSILQGRPQGMPAFAGKISESDTWKLVAYVQSLSGSPDE